MAKKNFNSISPATNVLFNILMILLALLVVVPMVLIVIISFSSEASISNIGFSFVPQEWSLEGYRHLFKMGDQIVSSYKITIFVTIVGTALSLATMTMFAYVLSQKQFWLRKFLTYMLAFTMLFGGGLVPSYILITSLGMKDTVWVYLLPSMVSAYNVIILRTFIQTTIPDSLIEAGRIDGAGHFRVFIQIVMPLFKAGVATIALFNVVSRWNDWFTSLMYIDKRNDLVLLQRVLMKIQDNMDFLKNNAAVASTPEGIQMLRYLPTQSLKMACTLVITIPILLAYPFFQRYFVSGLTIGSVKG